MKTYKDCLPCFLRQALQVARICSDKEDVHKAVTDVVSGLLDQLDMQDTPPANAIRVYSEIARITGCPDPYHEVKKRSNEQAMQSLPLLRKEVNRADNPLAAAVRFAIAGNIIDYGACAEVDVEATFARCRTATLAIDHLDIFIKKISQLKKSSRILYLADNCGEIVYDLLVLERLREYGLDLTVAVRGGPIINDALLEDAMNCGIDRVASLISNGVACPGTSLAHCSAELREHFYRADLVISKGQGNFETLSEVERDVFFLLTVKCRVAARYLVGLTGTDAALLPGKGEMVVYYSPYQPT